MTPDTLFRFDRASRSYEMLTFWCGRGYQGWSDDPAFKAAVKRHEQSGCKRCRRGRRRFESVAARMIARKAVHGAG